VLVRRDALEASRPRQRHVGWRDDVEDPRLFISHRRLL